MSFHFRFCTRFFLNLHMICYKKMSNFSVTHLSLIGGLRTSMFALRTRAAHKCSPDILGAPLSLFGLGGGADAVWRLPGAFAGDVIEDAVAVDVQLSVDDSLAALRRAVRAFGRRIVPCDGTHSFAPLAIQPRDTPVVAPEKIVGLGGHVRVVVIALGVTPFVGIFLCSLFDLVSKGLYLCSDRVFLGVVVYPPVLFHLLLKRLPRSQLSDPVLRPGGIDIDPCLLLAVVGVAEIPNGSEFPRVGDAQTVAVFV